MPERLHEPVAHTYPPQGGSLSFLRRPARDSGFVTNAGETTRTRGTQVRILPRPSLGRVRQRLSGRVDVSSQLVVTIRAGSGTKPQNTKPSARLPTSESSRRMPAELHGLQRTGFDSRPAPPRAGSSMVELWKIVSPHFVAAISASTLKSQPSAISHQTWTKSPVARAGSSTPKAFWLKA